MSTKNVWSECAESSKNIAQNNAEFIMYSGERIRNAVSHSSQLVSDVICDVGSSMSSEGTYTTASQQAQMTQPVVQKLLHITRENCDANLGIAEDANRMVEKNLLEISKLANSVIEEQSSHMASPHGDIWRSSGKQTLSSWTDACSWFVHASRQGIEAIRSALAAPIPSVVPVAAQPFKSGSSKK